LGDLLFIASGSFFLGIVPGFVGIMSGLLLFLVWSAVKGKKEQLPLAPALSIGYMLGLYIM
jgi:prepilin signal peptidase PulO-like enzyme (type II secretory pathway)